MDDKKILFVIFGKRDLINNFKENQSQYPSNKDSIELNNYEGLKTQIEYIHTDSGMDEKKYILLHVHEYDVGIFDYIISEIKDLSYLQVKFLVLNDSDADEESMENIQELVHAINKFKGDVGKTKNIRKGSNKSLNPNPSTAEKELNKLISSNNDAILNLDSLNYLIDVSRNFEKTKDGMKEELRNSILSSLLMISTKLEEENEKLLENE